MSDKLIEIPLARELDQFDPAKTKVKDAKLSALIAYAKSLGDWELLEQAVEAKIEEQLDFCRWWGEEVTPREGLNRYSLAVTERLPLDPAEWKMRVLRWRRYLNNLKTYRARLLGVEYRAANLPGHDREFYGDHENENEELYTPVQYIEAARSVLGEIDLDPASCEAAQRTVNAKQFFTKQDQALSKVWRGRVWLNPPYSQPAINHFTEKLVSHLTADDISAAILLTNNHTDTGWFHACEYKAAAICFTRGRIKFIDSVKGEVMPTAGQAFFYYGEYSGRFSEVFRQFGFIR